MYLSSMGMQISPVQQTVCPALTCGRTSSLIESAGKAVLGAPAYGPSNRPNARRVVCDSRKPHQRRGGGVGGQVNGPFS